MRSHARERRLPGEIGYEPAGVFTPDLREFWSCPTARRSTSSRATRTGWAKRRESVQGGSDASGQLTRSPLLSPLTS
jgi:hypothetical protein